MTRFFFAVVPPEPALSVIDALRARWGHPHQKVEPHITVKPPFPHEGQPERFLAPVRAALSGITPLQARLGDPARFGGAVLYLSVLCPGLQALHRAVLQALEPFAPPDPRFHEGESYTPHLTLAGTRFGVSPGGLDRMEREAEGELSDLNPFTVSFLRCYRRDEKDGPWQPLCDLPFGGL